MSYVLLDVTHNQFTNRFKEIKFFLDSTIESVKAQLYTIVGSTVDSLELELCAQDGQFKAKLDDNSKLLGDYDVKMYDLLHCIDNNPFSLNADHGLEDLSKVEKFMISDEEYDSMPDTYRAWKKRKLIEDPEFRAKWEAKVADYEASQVYGLSDIQTRDIKVGDRCEVSVLKSRGVVAFVGQLNENRGYWIGVLLDEPIGKNDGSLDGVRYFEAPEKYGIFVRPQSIATGDYPAIDWLNELDDEESEL